MPKINFCIETVSPVINIFGENQKIFAQKNGLVYFIDAKKLDKILSLMCLLGEYNEYCCFSKEKNITQWLKNKKLLTTEILEEISCGIRMCAKKEKIEAITTFSSDFCDENLIFGRFFRENLFNMLIFDYVKTNEDRINEYISNMLLFFEENKIFENKKYPLQFFMNCLFEAEKVKMFKDVDFNDNFEINISLNKELLEYFSIEKITNKQGNTFYETLKKGNEIHFEVLYNTNNIIFNNIDKYLQVSEFLSNQRRFLEEKNYVCSSFSKEKYQNTEKPDFLQANMSVLNINQVFYLCINEQNRQKLNELLSYNTEELLFYYKDNSAGGLEKLNYVCIKKEN